MGRRNSLKSWDAFTKYEKNLADSTASGGFLTLAVFTMLTLLIWTELRDWWMIQQDFQFVVDKDVNQKFKINLDMVIAMECQHLTVDVVDVAGTSSHLKHEFTLSPAPFVVASKHQREFDRILNIQRLIKEATDMGSKGSRGGSGSACRIQGSVDVNKVAGNLHITALGHGYAGQHVEHDAINFTHSITTLSFGKEYPGLVNPLDDVTEVSEKCKQETDFCPICWNRSLLTPTAFTMYQYFISLVPTTYVDRSGRSLSTMQYSVTDHQRLMDGEQQNGVPGVFIKYDVEPISLVITEKHPVSFLHFLVRLCGIIGGIFVSVGIIHSVSICLVSCNTQSLK